MCLQMMDERYESMSDIAEVFQYAADNGANIAQNSWGYEVSPSYMPQSDALAIDYFIDNAGCDEDGNQLEESPMKGGVVIFAAGNDEMNYSYPPGYERVIAVAAIGPTGKAAYYTNYGDWVDVAAPGGDQRENGNEGGVLSRTTPMASCRELPWHVLMYQDLQPSFSQEWVARDTRMTIFSRPSSTALTRASTSTIRTWKECSEAE